MHHRRQQHIHVCMFSCKLHACEVFVNVMKHLFFTPHFYACDPARVQADLRVDNTKTQEPRHTHSNDHKSQERRGACPHHLMGAAGGAQLECMDLACFIGPPKANFSLHDALKGSSSTVEHWLIRHRKANDCHSASCTRGSSSAPTASKWSVFGRAGGINLMKNEFLFELGNVTTNCKSDTK